METRNLALGRNERRILGYLVLHPEETSIYQVAKDVFGSGRKYFSMTYRYVKKLEKMKSISISKKRNGRHPFVISLLDKGKKMCVEEGIATDEEIEIGSFIHRLNKELVSPLNTQEEDKLRKILSLQLLQALKKIFSSDPLKAVWIYEKDFEILQTAKEGMPPWVSEYSLSLLKAMYPNLPSKELVKMLDIILKKVKTSALKELHTLNVVKKHGIESSIVELASFLREIAEREGNRPILERRRDCMLETGNLRFAEILETYYRLLENSSPPPAFKRLWKKSTRLQDEARP
ncbi:MAG: hypothetical protein QW356_05045 [Candidatus Hadarchaeales archaeon]